MKIFITIGIPGSGKSAWAIQKAKDENTIIISRDNIREMLKGVYTYNELYEPMIQQMTRGMIVDGICEGFDLIIDECNILSSRRKDLVSFIRDYEYPSDNLKIIAVYFKEKKRNLFFRMFDAKGIGEDVWINVIEKMKNAFEEVNYKEEGFDGLIEIDEDFTEKLIED